MHPLGTKIKEAESGIKNKNLDGLIPKNSRRIHDSDFYASCHIKLVLVMGCLLFVVGCWLYVSLSVGCITAPFPVNHATNTSLLPELFEAQLTGS